MNHRNNISNLRLVDDGHTLAAADTLALERALDALGAAERAGAPAGMTDRVFAATLAELGPRVAARIAPLSVEGRSVKAGSAGSGRANRTRNRFLTPLRAAAGVALAATVGVAILAHSLQPAISSTPVTRADPSATNLELYIDLWASGTDGPGTDFAAQASALDLESAALRDALAGGTASYDLWSEEGAL